MLLSVVITPFSLSLPPSLTTSLVFTDFFYPPAFRMEGIRKVVDTAIGQGPCETGMGSSSFCAWRVLVIDLTGSGWPRATPSSASFIPSTLEAMAWVLLAGATGNIMDG